MANHFGGTCASGAKAAPREPVLIERLLDMLGQRVEAADQIRREVEDTGARLLAPPPTEDPKQGAVAPVPSGRLAQMEMMLRALTDIQTATFVALHRLREMT